MTHQKTFGKAVACTIFMCSLFALQISAQTPAPEGKEKPKAEEKKEPKPVKKLQKPCAGKLVAMHAYSVCGPDKLWHVVGDDYYDCPPVQKFRVYDHATEQPCDKPAPDPIAVGFPPFNGSGCQDFKDIGPMDVYECHDGLWYLVTYEVYECSDGRRLVSQKDRQQTGKPCTDPKPELKLPAVALNETSAPLERPNDRFASLLRDNQIKLDITGTGETIGPIATLLVRNLTDQPISFAIPPMILESRSGKNQDYVVPHSENVALKPHESRTVPMDGVCVNRHKPPVGKGVGNDLAINDPSGNVPRDEHSHLKRGDADKLLRIAKSKYDAADKLEEDGAFKDMPYKDKKKRKEIVEQWSTWTDPRISEIEGGPPATKDDLKKVVDKQVGKVPPEKRKEIDNGIDTIFEKIELTTAKAKDLEESDTGEGNVDNAGAGSFNVSNDTPTPAPQTQEKKEKKEKKKKDKDEKGPKWPQPVRDWIVKEDAAHTAGIGLEIAQRYYRYALYNFCNANSKHFSDLFGVQYDACKKALEPGATAEDKAKCEKATKEVEKQAKALEPDFVKTPDGQKEAQKLNAAQKAADNANAEEKEAGKNIDQATKDAVHEAQNQEKAEAQQPKKP